MVYLVNQKRKQKQNKKRKISETPEKRDYEIIQELIILLSNIFW